MTVPELLEQQKQYYKARAAEYDQWFYRQGRYDFGIEHTKQWEAEARLVRQHLTVTNLTGQVLEFAAGTGIWTQELLKSADHVTALDSSAEVLEINRYKTQSENVTYEVVDIFEWQPQATYDAVFMGFWLSHIPPSKLSGFIAIVKKVLKPGGKIFLIDSLPKPSSTARDMAASLIEHAARPPSADEGTRMTRRLNDGREFEIVKVFYVPADLANAFRAYNLQVEIKKTGNFFLYGSGILP